MVDIHERRTGGPGSGGPRGDVPCLPTGPPPCLNSGQAQGLRPRELAGAKSNPGRRNDSGKRVGGVAVFFFLLRVQAAGIVFIAGQWTFYHASQGPVHKKIKIFRDWVDRTSSPL